MLGGGFGVVGHRHDQAQRILQDSDRVRVTAAVNPRRSVIHLSSVRRAKPRGSFVRENRARFILDGWNQRAILAHDAEA